MEPKSGVSAPRFLSPGMRLQGMSGGCQAAYCLVLQPKNAQRMGRDPSTHISGKEMSPGMAVEWKERVTVARMPF